MISLHYTSHTKAYNTIYTACNIVEAIYSFTFLLCYVMLWSPTKIGSCLVPASLHYACIQGLPCRPTWCCWKRAKLLCGVAECAFRFIGSRKTAGI